MAVYGNGTCIQYGDDHSIEMIDDERERKHIRKRFRKWDYSIIPHIAGFCTL